MSDTARKLREMDFVCLCIAAIIVFGCYVDGEPLAVVVSSLFDLSVFYIGALIGLLVDFD